VTVVATKELQEPPRVILSLEPLVELPCTATAATTYACTYTATGAERVGPDGHVTIDVRMLDLVGQEAVKNGAGGLRLDFLAPVLAARSVAPASVPLGGVVQVFFTASEDLGAAPLLHASRPLDEPGGTTFTPTRLPDTQNYSFTHLVTTGDASGPVSFTVDLTDAVGNSTTAVAVGVATVDLDPVEVSTPVVTPDRIRNTGTVGVDFDAQELATTLTVTVGGRPMRCDAPAGVPPHYHCWRAMVGDELAAGSEAAQSVVVSVTDAAGNRTTASGSVVFDFRPPGVASAALAYAAPDASPIPTVARAAVGARVTLTALADEALAGTPALAARLGGSTLAFTYQAASSTATSAVFTATVPTGLPDGDYVPSLTWMDVAGNTTTVTGGQLPVVRLKTSAPVLQVNQDAIVFVRSPMGNAADEWRGGYRIPGGPYFAIDPADALTTATTLPAGAILLSTGALPNRVLVRSAGDATVQPPSCAFTTGLSLGDLVPVGGVFPRRGLTSPDVVSAWLVGVDDAGNCSATVQVRDVEWVATPNGAGLGTNPHLLSAATWVGETRDLMLSDVDTLDGIGAAGTDSSALLATAPATPLWRAASWSGQGPTVSAAALAYDGARGRTVLFGGRDVFAGILGQTWEWDGTGWELMPVSGPPAQQGPDMVYDSARGRVVLLGQGTWEWDGTSWTQLAAAGVPTASGQLVYHVARRRTMLWSTSGTWEWDGASWTTVTTAAPPYTGPIAYDGARNTVVVTDGTHTATWNGTSWTTTAAVGPVLGGGAPLAMTYDTAQQRVVATGYSGYGTWDGTSWTTIATAGLRGTYGPAVAYDCARSALVGVADDTYVWDGSSWALALPPAARSYHAMAFDGARGRAVLFGGALAGGTLNGDTYEWNGWTWLQEATTGPSARTQAAMAHDSYHGVTILFGGSDAGGYRSDTWRWNGAGWTYATSAGPSARAGAAMGFDVARHQVVLFGGVGTVPSGSPYLADTWLWDGTSWTSVAATGPSRRAGATMSWDPVANRLLMYGGRYDSSSYRSDTWAWDGTAWTTATTVGPARTYAAMAYDVGGNETVLFGGEDSSATRPGPRDDTWLWDRTTWTQASLAGPPARARHGMVYDTRRWRAVMFGGVDTAGTLGDTWWSSQGGQPVIQFHASAAPLARVGASRIQRVRVRAYAGGRSGANTSGALVQGWATQGLQNEPGDWVSIVTNGTGVAASAPWLPAAPAPLADWQSSSAAEARRYFIDGDGLTFRIRPSGSAGTSATKAAVALDYVEVRVRYTAP
jgi:hypothetical protein